MHAGAPGRRASQSHTYDSYMISVCAEHTPRLSLKTMRDAWLTLLQGGRIIQQLRAQTGASIKVRDASVIMPGQLLGNEHCPELRIIAISQLTRCSIWYQCCSHMPT